MDIQAETIYKILYPRVEKQLLNGFYNGILSEDKNKFFAFTYVKIEKEAYESASYYLNKFNSHLTYKADPEKVKIYVSANSWHNKTIDECIEEGLYSSYSLRFTGMFYENEWYIFKELIYFGESVNEEDAKSFLTLRIKENDPWENSLFKPSEPLILKNEKKARNIEDEEFENAPFIVVELKKRKKKALNQAFSRYINEEVFLPFVEKLKINLPENYDSCKADYFEDFTLIFPQHKQYAMMFMLVTDILEKKQIKYFVYNQADKKIYEWIYRPDTNYPGNYYPDNVIEKLSKISDWNDWQFLNSSRTMDNEDFWNNYVFKKENNKFIYLKETNL